MIYRTEKRHDRNHAVSQKQYYTVLLDRPSGVRFFAAYASWGPPLQWGMVDAEENVVYDMGICF